jgi:RNA polymerase primary sigma factor
MSCSRAMRCDVSNSLQVYLREIKDESRLTAEDECNLAEEIARGDRDARSRMIKANLKLVVKIARDFLGRGLALDDLIGEGNLGLIRAATDFQTRFGTRFSTYASYWIKQSIRHALINTTTTIRLPAHMIGLLTRWRRAEQALHRERSSVPRFDDVALVLGLSETQKMLVANAR